jgi:hypothetical protein
VLATASRGSFLDAAQRAAVEVYREPLTQARDPITQAPVWSACASEWGRGPGFKNRVGAHLEKWFDSQNALKAALENLIENLWEQSVIGSLLRLSQDGGIEPSVTGANVIAFPEQKSA